MKLTEQQLAEMYTNSTKNSVSDVTAEDCLNALPASQTRLNQAEELLNDYNSAQAMKLAFNFKKWAQSVGQQLTRSQRPWFNFGWLKATIGATAFAFICFITIPQQNSPYLDQAEQHGVTIADDVISQVLFEADNDTIGNKGFESPKPEDSLFNGSFG